MCVGVNKLLHHKEFSNLKHKAAGSEDTLTPEPSAAPLSDEPSHPLPPSAKDEVVLEPQQEQPST